MTMDMHRSPRSPGSVSGCLLLSRKFQKNTDILALKIYSNVLAKQPGYLNSGNLFDMLWWAGCPRRDWLWRPLWLAASHQPGIPPLQKTRQGPINIIIVTIIVVIMDADTSDLFFHFQISRVIGSTGTIISNSRSFAFSSAPSDSSLNTTRLSKGLETYQQMHKWALLCPGWTLERIKGSPKKSSQMTQSRKQ